MRRVPAVLREQLGEDATEAFFDVLDESEIRWKADVMTTAGERFERRLIEEIAALKVQMAEGLAGVRQEVAEVRAGLREELAHGLAAVRQEMALGSGQLRTEIGGLRGDVVKGLAEQRAELLKWAFVFWVGQFFATASLAVAVIRSLRG